MTAYMDPQGSCLATARGDRDIGHERGARRSRAQKGKCTTPSVKRSIGTASLTLPGRSAHARVMDSHGCLPPFTLALATGLVAILLVLFVLL